MDLRAELLSHRCKVETVEAFGRELTIREMDGTTYEYFLKLHSSLEGDRCKMALLLQCHVLGEDGKLLYGPQDLLELSHLPATELGKVANAVTKLSGLDRTSKNSKGSPTDSE